MRPKACPTREILINSRNNGVSAIHRKRWELKQSNDDIHTPLSGSRSAHKRIVKLGLLALTIRGPGVSMDMGRDRRRTTDYL